MDDFIEELSELSEEKQKEVVHDLISKNTNDLEGHETVNGIMAGTNATGFDTDELEINDITIDPDEVRVEFSFGMSGEQDEDKPFCGSAIGGTATAVIGRDKKVSFEDVEAELTDWPDEMPEEEVEG